jgi:hypothetical protein
MRTVGQGGKTAYYSRLAVCRATLSPRKGMIVAWLFLVSSVFTLAKTVRDRQEAELMEGVLDVEYRSAPLGSTEN